MGINSLYNGLAWQQGDKLAGLSNGLASLAAGNTDFENNFYHGQREYAQELEQERAAHPISSILAEMAGEALSGAGAGKLLQRGYGVVKALQNQAQIRRGAKQLERALRTQEFTEEPIFAGRINQERIDAINDRLRQQGGKELESNKLFWPRKGQKHLYEGRIKHDGSSPNDVAQWQKDVFFGKRSEPFLNKEKYPNEGALKTPYEKGQIEGYLANEEGKTVGRTVIKKRKR